MSMAVRCIECGSLDLEAECIDGGGIDCETYEYECNRCGEIFDDYDLDAALDLEDC